MFIVLYFQLFCRLDIFKIKIGAGSIPSDSNDQVGMTITDLGSGQATYSVHLCQALTQNRLNLYQ